MILVIAPETARTRGEGVVRLRAGAVTTDHRTVGEGLLPERDRPEMDAEGNVTEAVIIQRVRTATTTDFPGFRHSKLEETGEVTVQEDAMTHSRFSYVDTVIENY